MTRQYERYVTDYGILRITPEAHRAATYIYGCIYGRAKDWPEIYRLGLPMYAQALAECGYDVEAE